MVKYWKPGETLEKYIDHTLLKAQATEADIARLCEEARIYGFHSVCVNGVWVDYCRERLAGSSVKISAVVGFPLGASEPRVKAYEAAAAVEDGASEIDMVLSVGHVLQGRFGVVATDIAGVVRAVDGRAIVKVILETGLLDDTQIAETCRVAEAAGAHYVKTSTGFGPGGATEAHVRLMRASVSPSIGVKAAGGIRDGAAARRMLAAGANRIGTSAGVAILSGRAADATPQDGRRSGDGPDAGGSRSADSTAEGPEANRQY